MLKIKKVKGILNFIATLFYGVFMFMIPFFWIIMIADKTTSLFNFIGALTIGLIIIYVHYRLLHFIINYKVVCDSCKANIKNNFHKFVGLK